MKKYKLYKISILINIIGYIFGSIIGNLINKYNFLINYKYEVFNYSLFLSIILFFCFISIIARIVAKKKKIELEEETSLENFQDNYLIKKKIRFSEIISFFIIIFSLNYIIWMINYDPDVAYCYFLCTIDETIMISIVVSFFTAILFSFIRIIFVNRKKIN